MILSKLLTPWLLLATSSIASALPQHPLKKPHYNIMSAPPQPGPRLIVYQQTYHDKDGKYISLRPLVDKNTGVTHVYLAAFHIMEGHANVTLNDHHPRHPLFNELWDDVMYLRNHGIKVLGMLGGAARGSYELLSHPKNSKFDYYYQSLVQPMMENELDGVDLDIEEPMELKYLERLIRRIKKDFGKDFIITLAPVYTALLPRHPIFKTLTHRMLNQTQYPPAEPLVAALCKPELLKNKRNLSGFNHLELELGELSQLISWYNVQFYCGWGNPTVQAYDALIESGWNPERLVLGVVTNPANGAGNQPVTVIADVANELYRKYGTSFGGIMGWEYYNAGMEREGARGPWEWVGIIGNAMGLTKSDGWQMPVNFLDEKPGAGSSSGASGSAGGQGESSKENPSSQQPGSSESQEPSAPNEGEQGEKNTQASKSSSEAVDSPPKTILSPRAFGTPNSQMAISASSIPASGPRNEDTAGRENTSKSENDQKPVPTMPGPVIVHSSLPVPIRTMPGPVKVDKSLPPSEPAMPGLITVSDNIPKAKPDFDLP